MLWEELGFCGSRGRLESSQPDCEREGGGQGAPRHHRGPSWLLSVKGPSSRAPCQGVGSGLEARSLLAPQTWTSASRGRGESPRRAPRPQCCCPDPPPRGRPWRSPGPPHPGHCLLGAPPTQVSGWRYWSVTDGPTPLAVPLLPCRGAPLSPPPRPAAGAAENPCGCFLGEPSRPSSPACVRPWLPAFTTPPPPPTSVGSGGPGWCGSPCTLPLQAPRQRPSTPGSRTATQSRSAPCWGMVSQVPDLLGWGHRVKGPVGCCPLPACPGSRDPAGLACHPTASAAQPHWGKRGTSGYPTCARLGVPVLRAGPDCASSAESFLVPRQDEAWPLSVPSLPQGGGSRRPESPDLKTDPGNPASLPTPPGAMSWGSLSGPACCVWSAQMPHSTRTHTPHSLTPPHTHPWPVSALTHGLAGCLSVEGLGPLQGLPWTEGKASAAQAPLAPRGLQGGGCSGAVFPIDDPPPPPPALCSLPQEFRPCHPLRSREP